MANIDIKLIFYLTKMSIVNFLLICKDDVLIDLLLKTLYLLRRLDLSIIEKSTIGSTSILLNLAPEKL